MKSVNMVQFSMAISQVWKSLVVEEGNASGEQKHLTVLAVKLLVLSICQQLEKELNNVHSL